MLRHEDLVLKHVELCKILEPTMKRLGIRYDGIIYNGRYYDAIDIENQISPKELINEGQITWRADKILIALLNLKEPQIKLVKHE